MNFLKVSILHTILASFVIFTTTTFIFYYSDPNHAKLYYLTYTCKTCTQAQILAIHDFDNGIYRRTRGGFGGSFTSEIRDQILKEEYNIETLYTGCVGTTEEVYCYMHMMARLLEYKYGWDFYKKATEKAIEKAAKMGDLEAHELQIPPGLKMTLSL